MILYHVLNRGVDKRNIFLDKQDYLRFLHNLFVLNDQSRVGNIHNRFYRSKCNDIASRYILQRERELLATVHVFCLMPNHYHLLLSPLVDDGMPRFMKKLDMAYAKYFNQKYKRIGTLFERRYRAIPVTGDPHFSHLPYYVHFNPLDLLFPEWRRREIRNSSEAIEFLKTYRWSSHLDYLGIKNFPSITDRTVFLDFFGGEKGYEKSIKRWLRDIDIPKIGNSTLE